MDGQVKYGKKGLKGVKVKESIKKETWMCIPVPAT